MTKPSFLASGGITNPVIGNLGNSASEAGSGKTFVTYFILIWNAVILIGGLVVLVYFIQAAIEWITAGGDSGKIQKARDRMVQSTIGLFVLVFSFIIINFINDLLFGWSGFDILNPTIPTANTLYMPVP